MPNRIKALRMQHQYSQEELAKATGLSRQTVSSYEREAQVPTLDSYERIADFFNCSVAYLAGKTAVEIAYERNRMEDDLNKMTKE